MRLAVTTATVAEVLIGPFRSGDVTMEYRYRKMFDTWHVVDLDIEIAEQAARLRATSHLKLIDAIQVASALAINAAALVTHDRDFSRIVGLRIIC